MSGIADLQEEMMNRQLLKEIEYLRQKKVCPACGWVGKTNLVLCWVNCGGEKQLEVAQ